MDAAYAFFLVLATATPLLSTAQPSYKNIITTAKPSTVWINNAASLYNYGISTVNSIVTSSVRPQQTSGLAFAFTAGFTCASTSSATCSAYFFAVFIVSVSVKDGTLGPVSPGRIVWSANRARPVRENATLEFTSDGNLVLRDADDSLVWSSSSSGRSVAGMMITEIGNLLLFDHRNTTAWQSFDHPTDTLVLGQSLLEGMRLIANTSPTNWTENQLYIVALSSGLYAYVESTPPQLYCFYPYLVIDQKTGNDSHLTKVTFVNGSLELFGQPGKPTLKIFFPASGSTQYMRLESDGHLRLYVLSDGEVPIVLSDAMNINDCAYPTVCGEYGICTGGQCACPLQNNSISGYFKPVDERRPNLGCTPETPISCEQMQRHQLLTLTDISYFDKSYYVDAMHTGLNLNAMNIDDCKKACLKNCSCMAVFSRAGDCVWLTKVFSLQSIQHENGGYNSTVYLKVQINPSNGNKRKVIVGATLGAVTALALLAIFVILYRQRRRKYESKGEEFDFDQLPGMPTRFSFQKLRECTEGFSMKLGEGGFGSVFEGRLGEDRVAVKRLEGARQGKKEFFAEVETIGSIEHINIVRLIGFCVEKSERLLVYEYMSRGSLDRWIYYRHNSAPLDWCIRCQIILDIAKGLCYLHEECRRKIAHLDIKPQNILLDDNFNAKVADFGLCKLIDRDQSKVMTRMRGTPGYLAPEWLTSRITEKVDVYSFGVVIMEIVSGRRNIENSKPEENVPLLNLLREKAQENQLIDLIDKNSEDMASHQQEVIQMMKLAIWCLQHESIQRPSMSTVIKVLEGTISVETFDADSLMFVRDNPSKYSVPSHASILSGPR